MCTLDQAPTTGILASIVYRGRRRLKALCLAAATLTIAACAHAPVAPEAAQQEALAGVPPNGKAGIYFVRPAGIVGSAGCFYADVDGRYWGALANGQYFYEFLSPGHHVFSRFGAHNLDLNTEPGKNYYVAVSVANLKLMSEAEGRAATKKAAFNPDRWNMRLYDANWPAVQLGMHAAQVAALLPFLPLPEHIADSASVRYFGGLGVIVNGDTTTISNALWDTQLSFRNDVLVNKVGPPPGIINQKVCDGGPY
jgi:hypothetical protein